MTGMANEALEEIAQATPAPRRVQSSMRLDFSQDHTSESTILSGSYQEPPLKVVRAFTLEDGTALAHLHNVSGGLLGGDNLKLNINLERRARVQITTTGATRIYRQRSELGPTSQCNEIAIGEEALLEYVPDTTIPFAGARFHQRTAIELSDGAGLFWWEILSPGREARGEVFEYDQFEMKTSIAAKGKKIAAENIGLRPRNHEISSLARFGQYRYAATFYICRVGLEASAWRACEEQLRNLTNTITRHGEILWGVSTLVEHGVVVRCLSLHGRDVLPGLLGIWSEAKVQLYGRKAVAPRKVN